MKLKGAAFVMLFVVLSLVSLYSVVMYQKVLAQDAQEGQLLSQVKISRIEYDSSDPKTNTGASDGIFLCTFTFDLPANYSCRLPYFDIGYYRYGATDSYAIASGFFSKISINSSNSTFTVEMSYVGNNAEAANNTTPVFRISAVVMHDIAARELIIESHGGKIENTLYGRANQDQTYDLLALYANIVAYVWIIGLGLASAAMVLKSERTRQIERWVACTFLLNIYGVIAVLILSRLTLPEPASVSHYMPLGNMGDASVSFFYYLSILIIYGVPNLYLFITLFFKSRSNRGLIWGVCVLTIAAFALWIGSGGLVVMGNLSFWAFTVIAVINAVTLVQLERKVLSTEICNGGKHE
jgi:hypothetical protein